MKLNKRLIALSIFMFSLILLLAACTNAPNSQDTDNADQTPDQAVNQPSEQEGGQSQSGEDAEQDEKGASNEDGTRYPLTVRDDSGISWEMAAAPERIVSTSPAETEILFALGLGDKVVAVSDYCTYPPEAAEKPKVGGIQSPNVEAILAADADLVMTGISINTEHLEHMRNLGLKVYSSQPETIEDIIRNIERIGEVTNTQAAAQELVAKMRADIAQVKEAAAKVETPKRVYVEFAPGWTVGSGEYLHELIEMSGAVNIFGDLEGWGQINEEKVIEADPQVILYPEGLIDFQTEKPIETLITARSGWEKISAIAEGRIYGMQEDLLTIPGPRITQGLLEMATVIYPELMQ